MFAVSLLAALCASLTAVSAHVALSFEPARLPIRNARAPTANGQMTTAADGCGGAREFGANGVAKLVVGDAFDLHFNYGCA